MAACAIKDFNTQLHIDKIKQGLTVNPRHNSEIFSFMLKHKHFNLKHGEIIWVDRVENGYNSFVLKKSSMKKGALPCTWLYSKGWKAFAYSTHENGLGHDPNVQEGDYNLGVRWLYSGGMETTDEGTRTQAIRPCENNEEYVLTTMVNWYECTEECPPRCKGVNGKCYFYSATKTDGAHVKRMHKNKNEQYLIKHEREAADTLLD